MIYILISVIFSLIFIAGGLFLKIAMNKLYKKLENSYPEKIIEMNLPKRFDMVGPAKALRFFEFLFGSEYFNDEEIKKWKNICKNLITFLLIYVSAGFVCLAIWG